MYSGPEQLMLPELIRPVSSRYRVRPGDNVGRWGRIQGRGVLNGI